MAAGRCTFAAMCHTFPRLGSRGRDSACCRERALPRKSLLSPGSVCSVRIRPPSSLKRVSSGEYQNFFRHVAEAGWKTLTLCCNFGPAAASF